jgi:DNA-binding YbaB/EbfC family protein
MFDLFGMMDKINRLKEAVEDVKHKLGGMTVTSSSQDEMVTVVCTGNKHIKEISLSDEAMKPENKEMLEDLLVTTVNDALIKAGKMAKEETKKATEGLVPNIPGLDLSNFGL